MLSFPVNLSKEKFRSRAADTKIAYEDLECGRRRELRHVAVPPTKKREACEVSLRRLFAVRPCPNQHGREGVEDLAHLRRLVGEQFR